MYGIMQAVHADETTVPGSSSPAVDSVPAADISFAYSLRLVKSSYAGPLIQLRRASDNALQDFGADASGSLSLSAVTAWSSGSVVSAAVWYNQTGGANAVQTTLTAQPVLAAALPLRLTFNGSQWLTVPVSVTVLTNNGIDGSLMMVATGSSNQNFTFGSVVATSAGSARWSAHVNWNDGNAYFDTGICCQSPRATSNPGFATTAQYSFIRYPTSQTSRRNGVVLGGGTVTGSASASADFGIGTATGSGQNHRGTITEILFTKTGLTGTQLTDIEAGQKTFWAL